MVTGMPRGGATLLQVERRTAQLIPDRLRFSAMADVTPDPAVVASLARGGANISPRNCGITFGRDVSDVTGTTRPGCLAGVPPLSIAVVALRRSRSRFCAIRSVSGLSEHPAQVDGHLLVDVFASRCLEYFCFGSQGHGELAVVLVGYGSRVPRA